MKRFYTIKSISLLFYALLTLAMTVTYLFAISVFQTWNSIIIPAITFVISTILFYLKTREDRQNDIQVKSAMLTVIEHSLKRNVSVKNINCFCIVSDMHHKDNDCLKKYTEEELGDAFLLIEGQDKKIQYYCMHAYSSTMIEKLACYLVKIGLKEVVREEIE